MKFKYALILLKLIYLSILSGNAQNNNGGKTSDLLLIGEWEVSAQSMSPLIIAPHCKDIRNGTIFRFTQAKTLEIYKDASEKPCDVYHYNITKNAISFSKNDMVWLCFFILNQNTLKITSTSFFNQDSSDSSVKLNKTSNGMQEVVVNLRKKKQVK
jgi:hypothetical protein